MNNTKKDIFNNIKYGNHVEESIPEYLKYLSGLYKKFSEVNIAMNYFMFYEKYVDLYNKLDNQHLSILQDLNILIHNSLTRNIEDRNIQVRDLSLKELGEIRNYIIHQMKILTNYTDSLLVYEYVLKRTEPGPSSGEEMVNDELLTNRIMDYIFNNQDQASIKTKLSDIIRELPVRMSRYKYLDLLRESFSAYEKQSSASLESYVYMIRSSAMLNKSLDSDMEAIYPKLNSIKKELETTNYRDLSLDEWVRLNDKLKKASREINDLTDYFYDLQEIVNQLYIYLLNTRQNIEEDSSQKQENPMLIIIEQINDSFLSKDIELREETQSLLNYGEGVQEEIIGDISQLESIFPEIQNKYGDILKNLNLDVLYNDIKLSQKFFSSSLFFELDKTEDSNILSKDEINKEKDKLIKDLEELFSTNSRYVNRAVMANTLGKFPNFLANTDEVYEYIKASLAQCRDNAEKKASANIIEKFWE